MSDQVTHAPEQLTLDSAYNAMEHWRTNKKSYSGVGIPDKLWKIFFSLEDQGYSGKTLRTMFSLNSQQYNKKRNELAPVNYKVQSSPEQETPAPICDPANTIKFGEATPIAEQSDSVPSLAQAASKTKQAISCLKATTDKVEHFLDQTTTIVEVVRPDGHRLKIHATQQSLDIIISTFCHHREATS